VAGQREALEAHGSGDEAPAAGRSYPTALVRLGLLTELHRDTAALVPLARRASR
jgi:hypothetical protein